MVTQGVTSVRSPVKNLQEFNPTVTHDTFVRAIIQAFCKEYHVEETVVMDAHILSYFSVFYTDLFDRVFVFESLSLDMIRWLVTCCHHVHSKSHEVSCDVM